jgi:SAM-dependent methyltransferase
MQLEQHQVEIQENLRFWQSKPLLQQIYAEFYHRILKVMDPAIPGTTLEIGSGIGNLKAYYPSAICSDLFPNAWLDLVCDGYELPMADASISHLVLFDVFHHLEAPVAFLKEARRVLTERGRLIVFDPYISLASFPIFGLLHHEPIAWTKPIDVCSQAPLQPRRYYAAEGNATRLFFSKGHRGVLAGWSVIHAEAFAGFSYLLSGGYSKPAVYPAKLLPTLQRLDRQLSRWPWLFGARCLVALTPTDEAHAQHNPPSGMR